MCRLNIGRLSIAISVEFRSICRSISRSTLDQYGGRCIGRHIGWHVGRHVSTECRPTYRPIGVHKLHKIGLCMACNQSILTLLTDPHPFVCPGSSLIPAGLQPQASHLGKSWNPILHSLHFCPWNFLLHWHWPSRERQNMLREPRLLQAQAENHKGTKDLSTTIKKKRKIGLSFADILVSASFLEARNAPRLAWRSANLGYWFGQRGRKKIGTVS